GEWPARIRHAADELAPKRDGDSDDTMLLADIKTVFDERGIDRLASDDLCETLVCMEGKPWAEYGRSGKPISKNQLARRLDRFAIHPDTVRIGNKTPKGYYRRKFADAWTRYLGDTPPSEPQHRNNADNSN